MALGKFLPHNRKSDLNEPRMVDGKVVMMPEIGEALAAFSEAGFIAVRADYADGGMPLPFVVATACDLRIKRRSKYGERVGIGGRARAVGVDRHRRRCGRRVSADRHIDEPGHSSVWRQCREIGKRAVRL